MTEPAAIKATFADFKIVRGRKQAQLIFEVPLEEADKALSVLGGIPQTATDVWCGIARLNGDEVLPTHQDVKGILKLHKKFSDLPIVQQVGIICNEPMFWKFLSHQYNNFEVSSEPAAAAIVRDVCGVESRAQIKANDPHWQRLHREYDVWKTGI